MCLEINTELSMLKFLTGAVKYSGVLNTYNLKRTSDQLSKMPNIFTLKEKQYFEQGSPKDCYIPRLNLSLEFKDDFEVSH